MTHGVCVVRWLSNHTARLRARVDCTHSVSQSVVWRLRQHCTTTEPRHTRTHASQW